MAVLTDRCILSSVSCCVGGKKRVWWEQDRGRHTYGIDGYIMIAAEVKVFSDTSIARLVHGRCIYGQSIMQNIQTTLRDNPEHFGNRSNTSLIGDTHANGSNVFENRFLCNSLLCLLLAVQTYKDVYGFNKVHTTTSSSIVYTDACTQSLCAVHKRVNQRFLY